MWRQNQRLAWGYSILLKTKNVSSVASDHLLLTSCLKAGSLILAAVRRGVRPPPLRDVLVVVGDGDVRGGDAPPGLDLVTVSRLQRRGGRKLLTARRNELVVPRYGRPRDPRVVRRPAVLGVVVRAHPVHLLRAQAGLGGRRGHVAGPGGHRLGVVGAGAEAPLQHEGGGGRQLVRHQVAEVARGDGGLAQLARLEDGGELPRPVAVVYCRLNRADGLASLA